MPDDIDNNANPDVPPTDPANPDVPPTDPAIPDVPPTDPANRDVPPTEPANPDVPPTDPAIPDVPPTDPAKPDVPPTDPATPDVPPTDPANPDVPPTNTTTTDVAKTTTATTTKTDQRLRSPERDRIFTWLTVGQYAVLGVIGIIIVYFLFAALLGENKAPFLFALSKPEVARGVITFLVAAGTVSLAVLLVMAAIMSSGSQDLDHRFAFGKEVLTLLIGILGTIVGFYYGSAKDNVQPLALSPVAISEPAPQIGGQFSLDAMVIGGESPYTYSIKFNPSNIIPDVIDQSSAGPIHHEFTIPADKGAQADQKISFTIEVKDAKDQTFTYNEDGKQSITLKAAASTPSTKNE